MFIKIDWNDTSGETVGGESFCGFGRGGGYGGPSLGGASGRCEEFDHWGVLGGDEACLGGMVDEIAGNSVFCASSYWGGPGCPGGASCRGGSGSRDASGGIGEMVFSWGSGIRARAGEAGTLGPGICDFDLARARAGDDSVEGSGASCWGSGYVERVTEARRGVDRTTLLGDAA